MRLHTMCHNQVSNVYIAQVTFVELIMTKPHFLVDNTTEFDNKIKMFLMSLHVQCSQLHQKVSSKKQCIFLKCICVVNSLFTNFVKFSFFYETCFYDFELLKGTKSIQENHINLVSSFFTYLFLILLLNPGSLKSMVIISKFLGTFNV